MTDPDANPTKPRPHGAYSVELRDGWQRGPAGIWRCMYCGVREGGLHEPGCKHPRSGKPTTCRAFIDPEQHITADEAERFTEEYARKMGVKR